MCLRQMETHLWQQRCRARTIGLCAMIWMARQNGQGTINLLGQHRAHKQMWPCLRAKCELQLCKAAKIRRQTIRSTYHKYDIVNAAVAPLRKQFCEFMTCQ